MFQDISPHVLNIQYSVKAVQGSDFAVIIKNGQILMLHDKNEVKVPTITVMRQHYDIAIDQANYLLSIENNNFFAFDVELVEKDQFTFEDLNVLRTLEPKWIAFAMATATHLANWYLQNRFCGHCAHQLVKATDERKLVCPNCGMEVFPKISPVIIVGVRNDDRLLLTKYAQGYDRFALIAGFVEIGETLEDAVRREVYEETGLEVKNIRYYKSQPWAFSQSVLMGFFADVTGENTYTTEEYHSDEAELALAKWFDRQEIPADDTTLSLTWSMIAAFRNGEVK
ncbi:NAD(+) diphosphatase [Paucilactobacillus kaifaensis]|uniref:NAD(+) diphosphatase n=1 Tax=Paucilactobacillus kaifaensis TaxID=2559921 RepID=UPI0010F9547E|nr:NAD(+) diphosphatase [Paucilactobacillus kaifaensis]